MWRWERINCTGPSMLAGLITARRASTKQGSASEVAAFVKVWSLFVALFVELVPVSA